MHFGLVAQTNTENWVKTTTYKVPTTVVANPSSAQKVVNVSYFDGLGRPIQNVAHQQSNSGKDIVTHIEYDAFGRQTREYLPFVADGAASLDIKSNQVASFYSSTDPLRTGSVNFPTTAFPYSEKLFEASPLNRVFEQAAPGESWELNASEKHTIRLDYQTNEFTGPEAVKLYQATANWDNANTLYGTTVLTQTSNYAANQLYKSVTKNENWKATDINNNTVHDYKDKEGKVILKRTFNSNAGINQILDTYYVYDQYGNLTYVLPPAVTSASNANQMSGLCYQYKYDYRNRLVEKKLPGKQWEFIVYDKLDRVVATGPAFSPFTDADASNSVGWLITKYDGYNRVVYTAWKNDTTISAAKRKMLQDQQNVLRIEINETKSTNTTIDGFSVSYTNNVLPTDFKLLTVNYYDDYNFPNTPIDFSTVLAQPVFYNNSTQKPKGLATGSWVRVLEGAAAINAETTYTLYDYKARPIRTYAQNYLGGYTQTDANLDFVGKTLFTETRHKRLAANDELLVREEFTYSPQDRLITHTHKINSNPTQLLTKNTYDELGQLIAKNVGGTDVSGIAALQKVDYTYNIRGWMTGINDVTNLSQSSAPPDLFAFKINYNTTTGSVAGVDKLYNGNIAETFWRSGSDNVLRKYGYNYDALNRLQNAFYQKPDAAVMYSNCYNESLTYDISGNIKTLSRNGVSDSPNAVIEIDKLYYIYNAANPHQLSMVYDESNNPNGFKDDAQQGVPDTTIDYGYDNNGNLLRDDNKNITNIIYNHLNLPIKITFGSTGTIEYLYTSIGKKVTKRVYDNVTATATVTDYLDGFQYRNTIFQFFPFAEGYVNVTTGITTTTGSNQTFDYVFSYLDHLGNVRLNYTKDPNTGVVKILEENHYYPFGLKHQNYNSDINAYGRDAATSAKSIKQIGVIDINQLQTGVNKYKYNGKELQDELGLNMYDYGNRNYDPAIGRFMNMDRFAEKYYKKTPYQYAGNNPILFNDIKGDSIAIYSKQDKKNVVYENGQLYTKDAKGKNVAYNGKNVKVDKNGNKTIGGFLGKTLDALNKISSGKSGNELVSAIQSDSKFNVIKESNDGTNSSAGVSGRVRWDPLNTSGGPNQSGGTSRDSYIGLAHELGHVLDGLDGTVDDTPLSPEGGTKSDIIAMHWENRVRGENNVSLRTSYGYDSNGNVIGQALNPNGTSNYFTQPATLQQQSGGANPTPVSSTSPIVIPFRY